MRAQMTLAPLLDAQVPSYAGKYFAACLPIAGEAFDHKNRSYL